MSKSTHTLKVTKGSTTYTCDLYTTTAEAKVYNSAYLPVTVDGTNLYAALYPTTYSQVFYDDYGTPVHIEKGGTEYVLATKSLIRLGITAVSNETITVTAGGASWTSGNKYFPYGTTWTATVAGATGYNAGSLTPGSSGTLTNANVTVTAGAASLKTYTLKLNATTHQTITLKYKNRNAANTGFEAEVTKTSTSSAQSFTVRHGTTWTATIAGATGWTAGALTPGSSGTVTAATTVSAGSATYKTFTLKLNATSHQTITLKYKNKKSDGTFDSEVTKTSTSSAQSFTVGYGTTWTASLAAATGYTKGTLSGSSGTVTAATTVSATAATAITPKITFTWTADGWTPTATITYTNTSGSSATATKPSSVTIKYNTTIKITDTKNSSRYYLKITQGSTYKKAIHNKESWTSGALTANTTFKIVGYYEEYEGSSGEGSGGEGSGGE